MIRPLQFSVLLAAIAASLSFSHAQDPAPTPASAPEDLRAMRQMIEQQTLKIEALSEQVAKLNQQLEAAHGAAPAPTATPSQSVAPSVKAEAKPAEPPRAEAVAPQGTPQGTPHVVARGETLTSIAKHYKTSVADLLKANKIEDDRKLQIGQVLIIPPQKDQEPATPRKEID